MPHTHKHAPIHLYRSTALGTLDGSMAQREQTVEVSRRNLFSSTKTMLAHVHIILNSTAATDYVSIVIRKWSIDPNI